MNATGPVFKSLKSFPPKRLPFLSSACVTFRLFLLNLTHFNSLLIGTNLHRPNSLTDAPLTTRHSLLATSISPASSIQHPASSIQHSALSKDHRFSIVSSSQHPFFENCDQRRPQYQVTLVCVCLCLHSNDSLLVVSVAFPLSTINTSILSYNSPEPSSPIPSSLSSSYRHYNHHRPTRSVELIRHTIVVAVKSLKLD